MKRIILLCFISFSFFNVAIAYAHSKKNTLSIKETNHTSAFVSDFFSTLDFGADPIDAYTITKKINELSYYAPTTPSTPGTATTFTGTDFFLEPSAVALSTTQFVIAYRSSASGTPGEAIVGTLSGNAISFGNRTQFASTVGATHTAISAISATQFIVAFEDERGVADVGEMRIGTVSGNTISFGSSFDFAPGDVDAIEMEALSSSSHIVVYRDVEDSNRGKAKIITVSGATLSFGTAATFLTDATIWTGLDVLSPSTFVVVYQATTAGSEGGAVIGSVSGSTIILGSANIFETNCRQVDVVAISSNKFVVSYDDDDDGNGYVQVGSVSGTTITGYGTRQQLVTTVGGVRLAPSSSDKFIAMYTPTSGTDPTYAKEGEVIGTDITLSAQATIHSGNSDIQAMEVVQLDNGKHIYIYQDESNGSVGKAIYGEASSPTPTPNLTATLTDALLIDNISNGLVNPGETLRYTTTITNSDADATGVNYTISTDALTTLVVGSVTTTQGTVTTGNTAGDTSTAINIGTITDGSSVTITFDVIVETPVASPATISLQGTISGTNFTTFDTNDPATVAAADATEISFDGVAPTGYSVAIDQSPINAGNTNAVSYTFSAAEVGATYNYTFSSSGGAGTVTGSGTVASATATISGINLSGLTDGTITLSVTLTDVNGNTGSAATDTETKETVAPTGYSVAIDQSPINSGNTNAVSYTFSAAEVGATYNYTFSSSGGAGTVTGSGIVASATATISGINLSGLTDGTITLSVTLTDVNGNTGSAATDTETKETVAPTGYSVAIDQSPINAGNTNAVSYTFSAAEIGATYNYTFSSSGGAGTVTGSGTVASATATISGINLSGLADGTITLSVTLTDVNGNTGSAATDTETKETVAPTGYSVAIDQSPINVGNTNAVSYTFSAAEVGATYNYTFSSSGGAGTVTGSGTVASATATISGINLSGLTDGTITLSVTLTDVNGNIGSAATDTETKETVAPTGYSVAIDQSPINSGNTNAVSYTFSAAEVGATYNYTFSSSGGAGTVTGSGIVASATSTISGINLSGLTDGTITLSVTLTDVNGNTGSAATDTETKETVAPTGYSVAIDQSPINAGNTNAVSYTFSAAEIGATYNYTFSSSGGAGTVTGSGTVASATATISGINLSGLADGTITLSVTLTDVNGNIGSAATDTETKETLAPAGYTVAIDQSPINSGNTNAVSYTFSAAEVGATYNYTFSSSGGAGTVTGSGTVASATATISGINLSGLADGTITLSVTLTDVNGNTGSAATDTETKEAQPPSGYSVAIDQSPINAGNTNAVSYTFSAAEVGATYNYTFSSSGGAGTVTGSGTVASATATISGINLSSLADGTITLSVTLTDVSGNTGSAATDTETKDTQAPTGYTVAIDQNPINFGNTNAVSYTFSSAEVGATYNYTFSTSGGVETITGSGTIVTTTDQITGIDLSGLSDGTVTLLVTLTDPAGNEGLETMDTVNKNALPPAASIVISDTALTIGETAIITITFSEAVTGFDNTDLAVPNGTLTTVTSSDGNITFTATYTPTGDIEDDTNIIVLDNTGVTDSAGNTGTGTTDSLNFSIDLIQPTVTVEIDDNQLMTGETATVTITFSEAVTGFDNTDLTIQNGVLTDVSSFDGDITFTAIFTPTQDIQDDTNIITIDNTGFTDIAGNSGIGTTDSVIFSINTLAPPATTLTFNNGFSPNGDGINDTWVIEGLENFPSHKIQLFNRSGNRIFEAVDYQNDWNGEAKVSSSFGNGRLPAGSYYYIIETGTTEVAPFTGWIYINY
ncbi:Ig-like domain-containing protein [Aquimarina algiphila]|uniref:Ig-like domain-containing protein n=3 Tax=Aquimarina algiphila TaxID=2047982 RepID=UPI00248F84D5|nr:Ig-like domain-containing protein [Aquimarina algiphila]